LTLLAIEAMKLEISDHKTTQRKSMIKGQLDDMDSPRQFRSKYMVFPQSNNIKHILALQLPD
jgi:hypothetical protein